jgi:CRP/FNR family cyclic AMP-dependent transcriptional regulator
VLVARAESPSPGEHEDRCFSTARKNSLFRPSSDSSLSYTPAVRLHRDAKVDLISHVPLFERCSKRELATIAGIADQIERPEGRVVVREGELGREFWVLVDGCVEVTRDGERVAMLGAGDFFGEIALVSPVARTATVTTASEIRALVISSRDFWTLLDESPRTQRKILEAVGDRLAEHVEG